MLNPGDRIGDWEIVLPLGQGGMGSVYRCRHALSSRIEAAVKVLKPTDVPGARERFIREAEALHNLSHPAIVSTSGFGLDAHSGLLWLAMDLVHGDDFETLLARGAFPADRVAQIFGPVAAGLAYAHDRGIAHRDIKPANIMLRRDGTAVLLDFGIAVQEGHERLTQEGVVPGTVAYAAPEQVTGVGTADPVRADLYALGQVLCECVSGQFTYPRTPDMGEHRRSLEILRSKVKVKAMDPGPAVHQRIRDMIGQATDPDPLRRGPPLHRWRGILDGGPILVGVDDEHTELHAAPSDLAMPAPDGVEDVAPILDADTDVHDGGGGVPWGWVLSGVVVVLLLGGGLLSVGAVGGVAAWWSMRQAAVEETEFDELDEVLRPEAPPETPPPIDPPVAPTPADPPVVAPTPPPSPPSRPAPPSAATGQAQLVVSSVQRSAVYLDGKLIRTTPLTKRLPAGVYEVMLMKGDGRKKVFTVTLEVNEKARRIWDFDKGQWRSFEGGIDEASLPVRPSVAGVKQRVQSLPAVGTCLAAHPVSGALTTRFVVAPDGSVVTGGMVQAEHSGGALEACVDKALRALRFRSSQIGAAVSVDLQP